MTAMIVSREEVGCNGYGTCRPGECRGANHSADERLAPTCHFSTAAHDGPKALLPDGNASRRNLLDGRRPQRTAPRYACRRFGEVGGCPTCECGNADGGAVRRSVD